MSTTPIPLDSPDRPASDARISRLLALPLIAFVAIRKLAPVEGEPRVVATVLLLAAFTLLYFLQPWLAHRFRRYYPAYLLLQIGVLQALGLLRPYEDTWALLYILLALHLRYLPARRAIIAWAVGFSTVMLATLILTLGWLPGLGFSLLTIALAMFIASGDLLYSQAEAAKQESQVLLEELQGAHRRLKEFAARAEELAAGQERDRLARELHDTVSQMIFSISLATESTRLLLDKDPARVPAELERLQELTGQALAQMRTLISQWRPG